MVKVIFWYLIMLHFLSVYYVKFRIESVKNKKIDLKTINDLLIPNTSYLLVFSIGSIFIWSFQVFLIFLGLSLIHFIIQLLLFIIENRNKSIGTTPKYIYFAIGQLVMIILFVFTTLILKSNSIFFILKPWVRTLLDLFTIHGRDILKWGCILLFVHHPTNMIIKQLLQKFKPPEKEGEVSNNAGAYIGTLERIIIALLLSANQYAAIGLVLTAKSIARYEKITTEKSFAEYYLLGTLLSTLIIIGAFLILN